MTRVFLSTTVGLLALGAMSLTAGGQLGSRPAEEWITRLERPERVAGLKIDEVVARLGLKSGQVVADIGAGAGVFSWPLARAVAPATVYAVEVDQRFIEHLHQRAAAQQLANVRPVLGKFEDPMIPEKVDLAFFHDVLHHVDKRESYVQKVASYVKPGGRIAVIELDATKPDASHRDQKELQVTREELDTWMTSAGLRRLEEIQMFEDKWFVIYGKTADK